MMSETISKLAGKPVDPATLVNVPRLVTSYFAGKPDPAVAGERVAFGTSGHRGSAFDNAFNEDHILAITQAICLYRKQQGTDGPLFIGMDTHALSEPALVTAIEVLAANEVVAMVDQGNGYTPTPVISHAILTYNRKRTSGLSDGIVITPSHNPPSDGGFKYNPPHGGPADTDATGWIENAANALIKAKLDGVKRVPYAQALKSEFIKRYDYVTPYVSDLKNVVDLELIAKSGVKIGIDPLGGAAVHFWRPVIERYGIDATVVNGLVDPTFRFMTADWDGKIRMDCSSPYAMKKLVGMRKDFDVAFANDTDSDRHGVVTASGGLMNPNHYLAVMIYYLFNNRANWKRSSAIGKTCVSSSIIDRVAGKIGRKLVEVPVGFKWFVDGLIDGSFGFGGEESAGASFLRKNGSVWTTDKDGLVPGLLSAEITARTGKDPSKLFNKLTKELGTPFYERIDAPATPDQKAILKKLAPEGIDAKELAGETIVAKFDKAPGNGAAIGGIKVVTNNGWFAARPSGTENVYKIYAESFRSEKHLHAIQDEAQSFIAKVFKQSGKA
jgi:phosphoglucomutase